MRRKAILVDLSTPIERAWLDRLQKARGGRYKITCRDSDGRPDGLTVVLNRIGTRHGWMPVSWKWVKNEVRKWERRNREEAAREIRNHVGAYI